MKPYEPHSDFTTSPVVTAVHPVTGTFFLHSSVYSYMILWTRNVVYKTSNYYFFSPTTHTMQNVAGEHIA